MATSGVWSGGEIVTTLFANEDELWTVKTIDGGYIITQVKETE